MNKYYKSKNAITLIALVITVVVLLILAGVTIAMLTGDNGIISRAQEASFKAKMSEIAEESSLYAINYQLQNLSDPNATKQIYAGELLKKIIVDEEIEMDESKIQNIRELIKSVGSKEEKFVIIYEGELYYVSQKSIPNNEKQTKWCEEIGIKIWEYTPPSGMDNIDGDYALVNGVYLCTPKINVGFVKEKTRYIKESDGYLKPGNWINKRPDEDWYDYKNQKWANIYVESNGIESYYVWIPRYAYKISETENERMDVKFIDIDNSFIDAETEKKTSWEELEKQGYKVPEAFYYGDDANYLNNKPLPGYWMSKYQLSEFTKTNTYSIDYSTTATATSISIKNIKTETTKPIAKYVYALNGKIVNESTNPDDFEMNGLTKGNKAINVTILDANGEIIGSMTKLFETTSVNPPDLTSFDKDTTFYVYWDENGIEHNEIPISQNPPDDWYDYGTQKWANILSRNNGVESYFVWIPRYQYALDQVSERSYVKFILGTSTETDEGYQIPEAFTWGDKGEVQLTGYWMSKYQLSTEETRMKIDVEMSAGSNLIRLKNITGTVITNNKDNLKFEYYKNGVKVHEGKDPNENYVYSGLNANTTYTITIIARNATTNAYVGGITKKAKTIDANKPDLTGYNPEQTYYVLYDDAGNETIGEKIKNDGSNVPKDWYDYSRSRWANIVVTDGIVENGKITGAKYTTYLVWIPRYEYRILPDREALDKSNRRIDVNFIQGTSDEVTPGGYQIPEAFYFGDNQTNYKLNKPIPGFWMTKYQLTDK